MTSLKVSVSTSLKKDDYLTLGCQEDWADVSDSPVILPSTEQAIMVPYVGSDGSIDYLAYTVSKTDWQSHYIQSNQKKESVDDVVNRIMDED